ncbi:ecto-ADP-ribosyltransferase 5-like [Carettochelys insculpta]|uniref:ecto-ADP-ribosyltransferase 5-like n=1 Tax=Carettochelys insculpta TaxID=44489 RepID=UPI003EB9BE8A
MVRPLLIPLTYVCLQAWLGTAQAVVELPLDMAPDAFDDQYLGCDKEMGELAPGLLEKEMTSLLRRVWEDGRAEWPRVKTEISLPAGFKDDYGIAVIAYTDNDFHSVLNKAMRENGKSLAGYMANFQFKAFHYFLTRALQLLRGKCEAMYKNTVYRGVRDIRFQYSGSGHMRFGQFASSSFKIAEAEEFGTDTFFTIHSCFGADIRAFSHFQQEEEVLIPVYEIFKVSPGKLSNNFTLWSTNRTCSYFNCAYVNGEKKDVCVYNAATRGGITFPSKMSPSWFGGTVILVHVAALKMFAGF